MASGVRTVTEHPGCPHPGCCSQPHPLPPNHPLWWLWEKGIAQSPLPWGKGCFRAGVPPAVGRSRQPPWKGYSWLFYKYIYIFFVARYCYLTSALGRVRGRIPTPVLAGEGGSAAPGGHPSALGVQQSPCRARLHCKAVHAFFFWCDFYNLSHCLFTGTLLAIDTHTRTRLCFLYSPMGRL